MTKRLDTMTTKQFNAALAKLELTPYAAAEWLGISLRTSHRYASGEQPVNKSVALLLAMYLEYGPPSEL